LPPIRAETHTERPPAFRNDRSHCLQRGPSSTEADQEKLPRLGEAPIQHRSAESPRHRSARMTNTEALATHAAYRRDWTTAEAVALSLPPRGNPECPPSVSPKRPFRRPSQDRRAAEATRWCLPNVSATEATVTPPYALSSAEASENRYNERDSTMRPQPTRRPASFHRPDRPKPISFVESPRDSPK
jgi:hypothetical protein